MANVQLKKITSLPCDRLCLMWNTNPTVSIHFPSKGYDYIGQLQHHHQGVSTITYLVSIVTVSIGSAHKLVTLHASSVSSEVMATLHTLWDQDNLKKHLIG